MPKEKKKELPRFLNNSRMEEDGDVYSTGAWLFNEKSQVDYLAKNGFGAVVTIAGLEKELKEYISSKGITLIDISQLKKYGGRGQLSATRGFFRVISYFGLRHRKVLIQCNEGMTARYFVDMYNASRGKPEFLCRGGSDFIKEKLSKIWKQELAKAKDELKAQWSSRKMFFWRGIPKRTRMVNARKRRAFK